MTGPRRVHTWTDFERLLFGRGSAPAAEGARDVESKRTPIGRDLSWVQETLAAGGDPPTASDFNAVLVSVDPLQGGWPIAETLELAVAANGALAASVFTVDWDFGNSGNAGVQITPAAGNVYPEQPNLIRLLGLQVGLTAAAAMVVSVGIGVGHGTSGFLPRFATLTLTPGTTHPWKDIFGSIPVGGVYLPAGITMQFEHAALGGGESVTWGILASRVPRGFVP